MLTIELDSNQASVSYVSSLLRVLQASLREVAIADDPTRRWFEEVPQPLLVVSTTSSVCPLTFVLSFVDPLTAKRNETLSSSVFTAFFSRFLEFVQDLPQRTLWGGAPRRAPNEELESEVSRRMGQLYRQFRRAEKLTLSHADQTIEIEGDRMEVS